MKVFASLVFLLILKVRFLKAECELSSISTASGTAFLQDTEICSGDLLFEDNFDSFDLTVWHHEITLGGGGNWEFEFYGNNRTNSWAEDGFLHIKPTYTSEQYGEDFLYSQTWDVNGGSPADDCTNARDYGCFRTGTASNALNPITSARIRTVDTFYFQYGTVEIRAKMPAGDWLWPAIWLLPRHNVYGGWPASGEIDLLESRGNKNLVNEGGVNVGTQQVGQTLHWGPDWSNNKWALSHYEANNAAGYDADFHTYKMVWTADSITFFIDDQQTGQFVAPDSGLWSLGGFDQTGMNNPWRFNSKIAPFDQKFYLIINLAVGGTSYFQDTWTNPGGKPWSNQSPTALTDFWKGRSQWEPTWQLQTDNSQLVVDYVRVYAL